MGEKNSPDGPLGIYVLPRADTSNIQRKYLDIPYASDSLFQKLDIYLPDHEDGPFPVIIAVHGGAWMMCDKSDIQIVPMLQGLQRGYAVVAINYRLSSEAKFPAQIWDIKAAIRWIRKKSGKYYLNPDKIALWGGSAGAYLSAMAGLTGITSLQDENFEALFEINPKEDWNIPTAVNAVVAWYGPTNFLKMDHYLKENSLGPLCHNDPDSPESRLLGVPVTEAPHLVQAANPENYVTSKAPPFYLQHGRNDSTVPYQHSRDLANRLKEKIGPEKVKFEIIEGAEHADTLFETKDNIKKILDFLDRFVK